MRRICFIIMLFLCFGLQGCEKDDYQEYETGAYVNSSESRKSEDASETKIEEIKETDCLNIIINQNQSMIEEHLKNFPAEMKWFDICWFDFTNDGKKELVLSKEYLASSYTGLISYQYVYDQQGNELFMFLSGSPADMNIYTNSDSTEFYICSQIHWGSNNNTYFYSKIVKQVEWKKEFVICEWDTRKGGVSDTTEGYHLFLIPLERETDLFCNPYEELLKIREDEDLKLSEGQFEEYLQSYKSLEENQPDIDGSIYCSENEMIMEIGEERTALY